MRRFEGFLKMLFFLSVELCDSCFFLTEIKEAFQQFIKPLFITNVRIDNFVFEFITNVILGDIEFIWHVILFLQDFFPLD
jgi:hypothetical protein